MNLYRDMGEFELDKSVVAIGTFDGLHIGHAALIERAKALALALGAPALALTFDRHPLSELAASGAPSEILSRAEKRARFRQMGVDGLIEQPFTPEFAGLSPEEFADRLAIALRPRVAVVGYNFHFGRGGAGDAETLAALGGRLGFRVDVVEPVCLDGEPVSSTRIRALLAGGDVAAAERLLGYPIGNTAQST